MSRLRADLLRIFAASVAAVDPGKLVTAALKGDQQNARDVPQRVLRCKAVRLLAVGKAAHGMALAARDYLGERTADALIIEPKGGKGIGSAPMRVMSGAHPIPDESSEAAGAAAIEFASATQAGELLLFLLSGGASSLIIAPAAGVTPAEKVATTSALMRTGASIRELNVVRKHLSKIKGGGLLRAIKPRVSILNLILSDVPDNDIATIGSGPAAPDPSTFADAIAILKRRKLWGRIPENVRAYLERGNAGEVPETLKPGDPAISHASSIIIGDNQTARMGAAHAARQSGYRVEFGRSLTDDAEKVVRELAAHLATTTGERTCVIAGGEPSVNVRGSGKGGRAQHCALLMAIELAEKNLTRRLATLFAGTDGIDGPTDAAGGIVTPSTIERAREARLDPRSALTRCDSYPFFSSLGDLVITGPTGTNVSDIFVGLVDS